MIAECFVFIFFHRVLDCARFPKNATSFEVLISKFSFKIIIPETTGSILSIKVSVHNVPIIEDNWIKLSSVYFLTSKFNADRPTMLKSAVILDVSTYRFSFLWTPLCKSHEVK